MMDDRASISSTLAITIESVYEGDGVLRTLGATGDAVDLDIWAGVLEELAAEFRAAAMAQTMRESATIRGNQTPAEA